MGHKQFDSDVPFTFEQVQGEPGEAIVRNLQPNTKYSVVVHAFNSAGSGPASHRLVVTTLDKDLPGPPNFAISHVSSTSVSVQIREKAITSHVTREFFFTIIIIYFIINNIISNLTTNRPSSMDGVCPYIKRSLYSVQYDGRCTRKMMK